MQQAHPAHAGARLQRLMPNAKRVLLPQSAHAPMLERDVSVLQLMQQGGVLPRAAAPPREQVSAQHSASSAPVPAHLNAALSASSNGAAPSNGAGAIFDTGARVSTSNGASLATTPRATATLAANQPQAISAAAPSGASVAQPESPALTTAGAITQQHDTSAFEQRGIVPPGNRRLPPRHPHSIPGLQGCNQCRARL